jgi:glutathione S-transferase
MRLRVHRIAFSTNVERVALALAHKGVAVTWVEVGPADRSAVIALSGQELVPVLETPDAVISDSTTILRWLELQAPDPPLWPADPAARATTDIAIAWFDQVWKRAPNAIDDELLRPHPDPGAVAQWSAEIQATLPWFEALLDGRDFLLGDGLGALDVVAFPFLKYGVVVPDAGDTEPFHWILSEHLPVAGRLPRLEAWIARIDALPRA